MAVTVSVFGGMPASPPIIGKSPSRKYIAKTSRTDLATNLRSRAKSMIP